MSLLADLLSTVFERRHGARAGGRKDTRPMPDLVAELIGAQGEVSGLSLAQTILDRFEALDDDGKVVGPGDIVAQTRQAVRNIEAILASQGATLKDVVKITVFIANRTRGFVQTYDETLGEFFPDGCPASTLVEVKSLVLRDLMVEIESVAVVGAGG